MLLNANTPTTLVRHVLASVTRNKSAPHMAFLASLLSPSTASSMTPLQWLQRAAPLIDQHFFQSVLTAEQMPAMHLAASAEDSPSRGRLLFGADGVLVRINAGPKHADGAWVKPLHGRMADTVLLLSELYVRAYLRDKDYSYDTIMAVRTVIVCLLRMLGDVPGVEKSLPGMDGEVMKNGMFPESLAEVQGEFLVVMAQA